MPDLKNFSVIRAANKTLTVPTWDIAGQLIDSQTGALLQDFSGANAVAFPQILGNLTVAQQNDFVTTVVRDLLRMRFGI